jgi:galactose mutarotase-like enzyme
VPELRTVALQNEFLQVTVLPGIGAKVFDLIHRPTGHNFLWHNPRIAPQPYPIEANFDNYWCGGWDDAFPTCEACLFRGEQYPNLGELRSIDWAVEAQSDGSVSLSAPGPISAVAAKKTVRLLGRSVEMEYEVTNLGPAGIDFLWGTHPAYAIDGGTILHVPARTGIVGSASDPSLGAPGQRYPWPVLETAGGSLDMTRTLPSAANVSCGHYATELSAGWYALEHAGRQQSLLFEFDLEICPYLWMWLSYGGWRGYHVAVIEPWTSYPVTLSEAEQARTHRHLAGGETFRTSVKVTPGEVGQSVSDLLAQQSVAGG